MKTQSIEATHLYEQLADKMAGLIRRGTLRAGDRVPSVRRLSVQEQVSISTALQAYFLLENRGLIEARPQSGFYVKRSTRMPPEPSKSEPAGGVASAGVGDLVASIIELNRRPDVVPLGAAMASAELFPNRKLHRCLSAAARRAGAASNVYDIPPGLEELRRQIALRAMAGGCDLGPDDIVVTAGCTEALNLCLRAVARPGDVLAVESPTYFVVLQIIESLGINTVEIPTYPREGICLDALTGLLAKTKVRACLLMPTVHNPLGATMPEAKRRKLVSILAERDIPLIEDDIFGDLHFGQRRPRAVKAFDKQGLVLLCSSFSKTLAPGYRVGWVAPGRYRSQVLRLKMVTTMGNPILTQMMIADFLQNGGYDQHLRRIRKAYASQVEMMTQAIDRHFPDGTRVTRPSGGFVVWVEFPKSVDALDLHRRALERRISIAPGPIFSPVGGFRNFARLNCGHVWSERIEDAIRTLGELAGGRG